MVAAVFTWASVRLAYSFAMDMSFSLVDAMPLDRVPLAFPALLARLDAGGDVAVPPCLASIAPADASPTVYLVAVLLGRANWTQAARALGNRFAPAAIAMPRPRKPL